MKKEVTQYFCDICGEVIPNYPDLRWLKTGGTGCGCLIDKEHVCPACYRVIEECVSLLAQGAKREG